MNIINIGSFNTTFVEALNWSHDESRDVWQASKHPYDYTIETFYDGDTQVFQLIVASESGSTISGGYMSLANVKQRAAIHADTFSYIDTSE